MLPSCFSAVGVMLVNNIETWKPECLLPTQPTTTPWHETRLPSNGDWSETVISDHSWNGVGLQNSMPLL